MLSERKLRKRSANVVARLMGFEGLPYRQQVHNQWHELQDKEIPFRDTFLKKQLKEDEACKDVFIDYETRKAAKVSRMPVESSGSERNFDSKRHMNKQCRSTDKRMHCGVRVKIGDLPYVVDSNKEVFIKCLENPSPLLAKHLHSLQSSDLHARFFGTTARNTMRVPFSELNDARLNSKRQHGPLRKKYISPRSFCTTQSSDTGKQGILKHGTSWSESEYEMSTFPRNIVVLKPNHRRSERRHTTEYVASDSDYGAKKRTGIKYSHFKLGRRKIYSNQEKVSLENVGKSEESRRNPKKKTCGVRIAASGLIPEKSAGYAGDESSFYSSEDELKEVLTSRNSADSSSWDWSSLSNSTDYSPLTMKDKIYFSEHCETSGEWKTRCPSKRTTLGEILSFQDKEVRAGTFNTRIDSLGTDKYGFEGHGACMCPQNSATNDGWRVKYTRDLTKNKSLRDPSVALRVSKSSTQNKMIEDDSSMWTIEAGRHFSDARQVDISENETSPVRNEKFVRNFHSHGSSNDDHSTTALVSQNKQRYTVSKTDEVIAGSSTLKFISDNAHLFPAKPHGPLEEEPKEDVKTCLLDILIPQEIKNQQIEDLVAPTTSLIPEPIFPVSSKEAEQPSPISALDFPDVDASSPVSECFGRVRADLQGLRAQVRMLELELAKDDDEEAEHPETNDNIGEDTVSSFEEKSLLPDEITYSSYIADVLFGCGFEDANPSDFLASWYSPDVPMELSMFEKLEEKYGEAASGLQRSERRLLFDRINSALVKVLNQYTNPCSSGKSIARNVMPICKNAIKDDLSKLLVMKEKSKEDDGNHEVLEVVVVVDDGTEWLNSLDNIHEICREVEETLLDELIAQVSEIM